ncbi:MAG: hypothetical protein WA369_09315 [Candidatus Acidiferrales bacterium]
MSYIEIKISSLRRGVFAFQIFKERSALVERADDFHRPDQHGTMRRELQLYLSTDFAQG